MYLLKLTGISITHIIITRQYTTAVNSFYLMYGYIFEIYFPIKPYIRNLTYILS